MSSEVAASGVACRTSIIEVLAPFAELLVTIRAEVGGGILHRLAAHTLLLRLFLHGITSLSVTDDDQRDNGDADDKCDLNGSRHAIYRLSYF